MSALRTLKKGEFIYRETEKSTSAFLIQSGSVSLFLSRQKQVIDLMTLGPGQIVGEHILWGVGVHPHSAIATTETKIVSLTLEELKAQFEASTPVMKTVYKGFIEKLKLLSKENQSSKLERDNTPCPPEQTAKIFGALYHAAVTRGEKRPEGGTKVDWNYLKQYAQRIFLESPKRMEMVANIFVKLEMASYQIAKTETGEEIESVTFREPDGILQFMDYFQYYYFKGGKHELLKTDERVMGIVQTLLKMSESETPSRQGVVKLDYTKVVETIKESLGFQLNADHFTLLETKGVFVKRQSGDKGVSLSFEMMEFKKSLVVWKILREIERWNARGVVELKEPEEKKVSDGGCECPQCHATFPKAPKFCSECGHKFAIAA